MDSAPGSSSTIAVTSSPTRTSSAGEIASSSRSWAATSTARRIVGADKTHDLAVLRLVGARPTPAAFADSSNLQVGDLVLAIGNPLGLRSSVTQGIVSSLGRAVEEADGVTLAPVIQTSAAINPGNSGGALVDLNGRVIGIPTLAATDPEFANAQAPGIGFAIPSNTLSVIAGT